MSLDFTLYEIELVKCPHCDKIIESRGDEKFSANITHNLNKMAQEAGIYDCLWNAEESRFLKASDIILILKKGLDWMKKDPDHFKQFNSENGWGTYDHFVPWIEMVLDACKEYPNSLIRISK